MKTVYVLFALVAIAFADDCGDYGDWGDQTDSCLWFPFSNIRSGIVDACGVTINNAENLPTFPTPPAGFPSEPCGHCSFKAKCRKREQKDGCNPVDVQTEHCHDGSQGDVCDFPKIVRPDYNIGCKYAVVPYMLQQCANRPDVPEWRRAQSKKFADIIPKFHCQEKDEGCACCCHPYHPNADGTACEMTTEPECEAYSDWNDWSDKCLFFPPNEMKKDFEEHCDFDFPDKGKEHPVFSKLKLPGLETPAKCGYCSFKIKCRTRSPTSAANKKECFPLDVDKKACGNEECEGCGDICELPKIGPDCDYNAKMQKVLGPAIKSRMKKMPVHMRHSMVKMILGLPHGKCVEKDDKCMCCCHPYEPNEDGTACVVKDMCKTPDEVGVTFDMNLPDDGSFAWLF
jgi:hypothetical protein